MKKLVFATANSNKVREVSEMFEGKGYLFRSLKDIGCLEDIPETKNTIEGNAIQKAEYVMSNYGHDCFAEDTGLEVYALDMEPGVRTARYAGEGKDPEANMALLLQNLKGNSNRKARFKTVVALVTKEGGTQTFEGICEGTIALEKSGKKGFGYDPIFIPEGFETSFAEMDASSKNEISHRGRAMRKFVSFVNP